MAIYINKFILIPSMYETNATTINSFKLFSIKIGNFE